MPPKQVWHPLIPRFFHRASQYYCVCVLLILLASWSNVGMAVSISPTNQAIDLTPHTQIAHLDDAYLTPQQASADEIRHLYRPTLSSTIRGNPSTRFTWVRVELSNPTNAVINAVLTVKQRQPNPAAVSIQPISGAPWHRVATSGHLQPTAAIALPAKQTTSVLVRLDSASLNAQLTLQEQSAFYGKMNSGHFLSGGLITALIITALLITAYALHMSTPWMTWYAITAWTAVAVNIGQSLNTFPLAEQWSAMSHLLTLATPFLLCLSALMLLKHWFTPLPHTRLLAVAASLIAALTAAGVVTHPLFDRELIATALITTIVTITIVTSHCLFSSQKNVLTLLPNALLLMAVLICELTTTWLQTPWQTGLTLATGWALFLALIPYSTLTYPLKQYGRHTIHAKRPLPLDEINRWYQSIRAPLTAIDQSAKTLDKSIEKGTLKDKATAATQHIVRAHEALTRSTNGLLASLLPGTLFESQPTFHLGRLIHGVIHAHHPHQSSSIVCSTDISPLLQTKVVGNQALIERSLTDILDCLHHLAIASNIHIRVVPASVNPHNFATITVALYTNDATLLNSKRHTQSLAIATQQLRQHGSELTVEQPAKYLALLHFDAPVAQANPSRLPSRTRTVEPGKGSNDKLLYVDTSTNPLPNIVTSALPHQFIATRVASATDALSTARLHKRLHAQYDVVVIEDELEASTTLNLALTIRQERLLPKKGLLILLTASIHYAKHAAKEQVFDLVLTKPISADQFYQVVQQSYRAMSGKRAYVSDPDIANAFSCQNLLVEMGYKVETTYSHDRLANLLSRAEPDLLMIDFDSYLSYKDKALPWTFKKTQIIVAAFSEQEEQLVTNDGIKCFIKPASHDKLNAMLTVADQSPERNDELSKEPPMAGQESHTERTEQEEYV